MVQKLSISVVLMWCICGKPKTLKPEKRMGAAARMIVTKSNDGGIVHDSLLHDDADVNGRFRDTTLADADSLYQVVVLVHQNHMAFLYLQVLHLRVHVVIDGR